MNVLRWILGTLLCIIFLLIIVPGITVLGTTTVVTDRGIVMQWVRDSEIYANVDPLIREAVAAQGKESPGFAELSARLQNRNDDLSLLLSSKLTPSFVQESAETIIIATYDWMDGKTSKPQFSIALAGNDEEVVDLFSILFTERLLSLPPCSPAELQRESTPFSIQCRPPGVTKDYVKTYLLENKERPEFQQLLTHSTFNSDVLEVDPQLSRNVQTTYKVLTFLPLGIFLLAVLGILAIVMILPARKMKTLRFVSISMLVFLIISYVVIFFGRDWIETVAMPFITAKLPPQMASFIPYATSMMLSAGKSIFERTQFYLLAYAALMLLFLGISFIPSFQSGHSIKEIPKKPQKK